MSACLNSLLFYCCVADGRCSRAPLLVMRALSIPFTLDVMTWSSSRCLDDIGHQSASPSPSPVSLVCDLMASNKRGIVRCGHGVLHCDSLHCRKRGIVRCGHGVLHCDSLQEGWTWLTAERGELFVVDMEYYTVTHCRKRGIVRCGHGVLHCDSLQKEGNCSLWTWSIILWLTAQRGSSKRNFVLQFYENQMSVFATIYALIYSGRGSRRFPSWCTDSKLKMCGDRFLYLNLENMACFYTFQARNNQGICCCCWLCDWKRCRENFFFSHGLDWQFCFCPIL